MNTINSRSTKAEILAVVHQQQAILAAGPDWPAVWKKVRHTATIASYEAVELIKDCYRLGRWTRKCYDQVMAELNQPIFKP